MKILKPGTRPEEKPVTVICHTCKSELEVERSDCRYNQGDPGDQRERPHWNANCAHCGALLSIYNAPWRH